jgi:hypothetical protein
VGVGLGTGAGLGVGAGFGARGGVDGRTVFPCGGPDLPADGADVSPESCRGAVLPAAARFRCFRVVRCFGRDDGSAAGSR